MEQIKIEEINVGDIWVIGEVSQKGSILPITIELIGEGKKLADQLEKKLVLVMIGAKESPEWEKLLHYGIDVVIILYGEKLRYYSNEQYPKSLTKLIAPYKPSVLLIGGTSFGREYAPKLAVCLQTDLIADASNLSVDSETNCIRVIRPSFDGKNLSSFVFQKNSIQIITVRQGVMRKAIYQAIKSGILLKLQENSQEENKTKIIEKRETESTEYHLEEATVVAAGGRGMKSREGFDLLEKLADRIGAEVASTRPCVDAGWTKPVQQVGQTGVTIKPDLYLAFGISGAIQHITGFSDAKYVIGINTNSKASIFHYCDYGVVGDAKKILEALIEELDKGI